MLSWSADKQANKQACLPAKQQPQTYKGKFSLLSKKNDSYNLKLIFQSFSVDFATVNDLEEDANTINADKLEKTKAIYARWKYKNTAKKVLNKVA